MIEKLTTLEKAALLSGKSVWESRDLPGKGLRSVFMSDGPHGVRKQLGSADHLGLHGSVPATCFPTAATVANSWDVGLAEKVGTALGVEAAALEVDVLLGPGLNIKRSPLGGRNFEYFSEDPYLSGKLAAGYVRGIQSQGVAATPKHFAVNSQELRRMASDSVVDERTLREIYLTAFEIVVREARPRALMSSYNLVNGTYAHENRHLLQEILRDEWGYDGIVITDWGGGNDSVAAIPAGGAIEMPAPGLEPVRQLVQAVQDGRLAEEDLDRRAAEVITLVLDARSEKGAAADVDAHHRIAREAAERSAVLLRNEDGILPLKPGTRIALIGDMAETPRYQGAGSSMVEPTRLDTAVEAFGDSSLELVAFEQGYRRGSAPDPDLENRAVTAARNADVVVVFMGLDEVSESEGLDRTHIDLPEAQLTLLRAVAKANSQVVVVLSAGSVVDLGWEGHCKALLHAYLSGQAGAGAIVRLLTGEVTPSGKLAETYPLTLADTPTAGNFPAENLHSIYREGPFVGYRFYEAAGRPVRYPFGHGLSYTRFEYSNLSVDDEGVRFTITNTGEAAGAEIAQLYVALPGTGLLRPDKELKGFAKVELEPGESREVAIAFDAYTWRHFDVATGSWRTEQGTWDVLIGASSADIRLRGSLRVDGVAVEGDRSAHLRAALLAGATDAQFAELLGRRVPAESSSGTRVLTINDPLREMAHAKSFLARQACKIIARLIAKSEARGKPDLNLQFIYNMPFRAIGKMSNGAADSEMVDGIVQIVNGSFFGGVSKVVGGYFRNGKANKKTAQQLAAKN
ncbi:MAG TPA: glycoside hydrolase family 3 C-terminal domain-containing protein [Arachnia sp.]|nr:glycoside hydrolase family 3 C-terminal domain-containing protein [Arachnia sp.]HMT86149.1 glycoside hydrolase family 3 C-terminal domain-containing protein [Arachnia sp.]